MHFKPAFVVASGLLVTAAVLALPRRREFPRDSGTNDDLSASASVNLGYRRILSMDTAVTLPGFYGPEDTLAIFMRLDERGWCPSGGPLDVGVRVDHNGDGPSNYRGFYQLFPNDEQFFGIPLSAKDTVEFHIEMNPDFSFATVMIRNNDQSESHNVTPTYQLCGTAALWGVDLVGSPDGGFDPIEFESPLVGTTTDFITPANEANTVLSNATADSITVGFSGTNIRFL